MKGKAQNRKAETWTANCCRFLTTFAETQQDTSASSTALGYTTTIKVLVRTLTKQALKNANTLDKMMLIPLVTEFTRMLWRWPEASWHAASQLIPPHESLQREYFLKLHLLVTLKPRHARKLSILAGIAYISPNLELKLAFSFGKLRSIWRKCEVLSNSNALCWSMDMQQAHSTYSCPLSMPAACLIWIKLCLLLSELNLAHGLHANCRLPECVHHIKNANIFGLDDCSFICCTP